jgi:hypothetical protein
MKASVYKIVPLKYLKSETRQFALVRTQAPRLNVAIIVFTGTERECLEQAILLLDSGK